MHDNLTDTECNVSPVSVSGLHKPPERDYADRPVELDLFFHIYFSTQMSTRNQLIVKRLYLRLAVENFSKVLHCFHDFMIWCTAGSNIAKQIWYL